MQLIPDLFNPDLLHVINDDDEKVGTVETLRNGYLAVQPDGGRKNFLKFQDSTNWLTTGREPKPDAPKKETNQLNLF